MSSEEFLAELSGPAVSVVKEITLPTGIAVFRLLDHMNVIFDGKMGHYRIVGIAPVGHCEVKLTLVPVQDGS